MVDLLVDNVHRYPSYLGAPRERITDGVGARKRRQEGGVDVENAPGERPNKPRGENAHEAGQTHEPDGARLEEPDQCAIVRGAAGIAARIDVERLDTGAPGARERASFRAVTEHKRNPSAQPAGARCVHDRLEVRAVP